MQVYAATLGQLVRDGAKLALIFGETPEAPPRSLGGELLCKIGSVVQQRSRKKLKELINYGREYRN